MHAFELDFLKSLEWYHRTENTTRKCGSIIVVQIECYLLQARGTKDKVACPSKIVNGRMMLEAEFLQILSCGHILLLLI